MAYGIALVKPNTDPFPVSKFLHTTTNEARTQTTPTSVTHINIEPTEGFKIGRFIDNKIKRYVGRGALAIPLRSYYRTLVFNKIFVGNVKEDAAAARLMLFLDYAAVEWPKATGKVSPLAFYNSANGEEWTISYNSANVNPYSTFRSSAYTRATVIIEDFPTSVDFLWNTWIDQLIVTEVWS